jgi:hypothetical protein
MGGRQSPPRFINDFEPSHEPSHREFEMSSLTTLWAIEDPMEKNTCE